MSLNIKNVETVRLVRQLAGRLQVSMTTAITEAVRAQLDALDTAEPRVQADAEAILVAWGELGDRLGRDYLVQDFDQALYDDRGLPR
jgi:hypothetical protein